MSKIIFTLEADNLDDFESVELNFRDKDKYDYTTHSTYDEDGKLVGMSAEYIYKLDEE